MNEELMSGDRVIVKGEDIWCDGCEGIVRAVVRTDKEGIFYGIKLIDPPQSGLTMTWQHASHVKRKENET